MKNTQRSVSEGEWGDEQAVRLSQWWDIQEQQLGYEVAVQDPEATSNALGPECWTPEKHLGSSLC